MKSWRPVGVAVLAAIAIACTMTASPGTLRAGQVAQRPEPVPASSPAVTASVFGAAAVQRLAMPRAAGNPVDWTEDEVSAVIEDHAVHRGHAPADSGVPDALVTDLPRSGQDYLSDAIAADGGLVVQVDETTRLLGWEPVALLSKREVTVRADPTGHLEVVHDRPVDGGDLWDLPGLRGVRSGRALVVGDVTDDRLAELSRIGDSAVAQASGVWGSGWDRRLVVVAPRTLEEFADQLGDPPTTARGFAAVTSGHAPFAGPQAPAADAFVGSRVYVNPDSWPELTESGRLFVLSHEATHVAAQGASRPRPPDWLAEGIADEVGLRASGLAPEPFERPVVDAVRTAGPPASLPGRSDFSGEDPKVGERAYAAAVVAVLLIERTYGRTALRALFRDTTTLVRDGHAQGDALAEAMRDDLRTTPAAFTRAWQVELRRLAAH